MKSVSHHRKLCLSIQGQATPETKQEQQLRQSNSPIEVIEQDKNLKNKKRKFIAVT